MGAAQEVLYVQGVEESMLGTMARMTCGWRFWRQIMTCWCAGVAEAEGAAEAVREADSVAEAALTHHRNSHRLW